MPWTTIAITREQAQGVLDLYRPGTAEVNIADAVVATAMQDAEDYINSKLIGVISYSQTAPASPLPLICAIYAASLLIEKYYGGKAKTAFADLRTKAEKAIEDLRTGAQNLSTGKGVTLIDGFTIEGSDTIFEIGSKNRGTFP